MPECSLFILSQNLLSFSLCLFSVSATLSCHHSASRPCACLTYLSVSVFLCVYVCAHRYCMCVFLHLCACQRHMP